MHANFVIVYNTCTTSTPMLFKMYNGEEGMDREGKRGEVVDLYVASTRRHFCDTQYKYKDNNT